MQKSIRYLGLTGIALPSNLKTKEDGSVCRGKIYGAAADKQQGIVAHSGAMQQETGNEQTLTIEPTVQLY